MSGQSGLTKPYVDGKLARLGGAAIKAPAGLSSEGVCDWRSGWRVADCCRRIHPDWGDQFIMWDPAKGPGPKCWN